MSLSLTNQAEEPLINDEQLDLQHYIHVIGRFKWRILSLAFIVTLLVAVIVFSITPKYTAMATLLIEAEQAKVVSIEEVYGLDSSHKEYFFTQFEILKSRQIAQRVVERLELVNNAEFDPDQQPQKFNLQKKISELLPFLPQKVENYTDEQRLEMKMRKVVDSFMSRLTITPIRKTQLVTISFESESPTLAATIVNLLAEVYIENHLEAKLSMTEKASSWLNDRLNGLKVRLNAAEKNLQAYQEKEQLVDIDGVKGLEAKEIQDLSSQLLKARQRLKQSENIYHLVQSQNNNIDSLATLPEVLNHQLIQGVNESLQLTQTKVFELKGTYGPKHPKIIAAQAELSSVRNNLSKQVRQLISGIANEHQAAKADERSLSDTLNSARKRFRSLSTFDAKQKELKRGVEINQQLYDAFFTRLKETREVGDFEAANARLIDPAKPPLIPSKPKKKIIIGLAIVVSLGLGVALAFLFEALNDGIRSVEDVESKLRQRMLGILPLQKVGRKKQLPLRLFFDKKEHAFSESIRTLRTSLLLLNIEHDAKVITVTSSVPGEGKTTVSFNLSFALGQLDKTLLIDADMRRPSIAKTFERTGYHPGLSNILSGTHKVSECVINDDESGIDIITAGSIPPNPQELLASDAFSKLITDLKQSYDRIIIDTSPTQAVSDAVLVSRQCDSLIYVVKADSTREKIIKSGLNRLMAAGIRIDGIVLNRVDLRQASKYGEYAGYYDQYGYNSEQQKNPAKS